MGKRRKRKRKKTGGIWLIVQFSGSLCWVLVTYLSFLAVVSIWSLPYTSHVCLKRWFFFIECNSFLLNVQKRFSQKKKLDGCHGCWLAVPAASCCCNGPGWVAAEVAGSPKKFNPPLRNFFGSSPASERGTRGRGEGGEWRRIMDRVRVCWVKEWKGKLKGLFYKKKLAGKSCQPKVWPLIEVFMGRAGPLWASLGP